MDPRQLLQMLMDRAGLNPNALAAAVHQKTKQPQIYRFLKGESREPRRSTLKPLADYFKVNVEAFFDPKEADKVFLAEGLRVADMPPATSAPQLEPTSREETEPVQPSPTLGATIIQLGALLSTLSAMGRESIAPLLTRVIQNPEMAKEAAVMADAIAQSQRLAVKDDFVSSSFGRAQKSPVETGFSVLDGPN